MIAAMPGAARRHSCTAANHSVTGGLSFPPCPVLSLHSFWSCLSSQPPSSILVPCPLLLRLSRPPPPPGRVKLTDLDGASLLPLADVQAAAAQVRAMAQQATVGPAAAGSYCMGQSAVWRALDWQRAPDAPSMMTPGFAPPEMTDAADPHMTALSHVYLVGASLEYVLTQLQDSKLAPGGRVTPGKERDAAFVAELLALAGRMQADAPVRRPTTRTLRQELEGMKARW